jgi:quercetin dioxygenase-like cupin family protein
MAADIYRAFDLANEVDGIDATQSTHGHAAKTLVSYDNLRVVLIVLKTGSHIPSHRTEGCISIHALRGRIKVRAEKRTFDLEAGSLVALNHDIPHDVEALEDSAFLLTIGHPS